MKSTGRYYRHYKGDYYEVLSFNGIDSDSEIGVVAYTPLYESGTSFFVQPLVRFSGMAIHNGTPVDRFVEVSYDALPRYAKHFVTVKHIPNVPTQLELMA